ncbi:MAG TPA: hydrogenase, partial [Phycisphaerae bacterium]|nr:hydrogenase [Phycisphaerae bacterium]
MTLLEKDPIIGKPHTYDSVTERIDRHVRKPVTRTWLGGFAISFMLLMLFNAAVTWLFIKGIGIWGINIPVGWGLAITNFVWWIGIGHAGTFISAILLLL